MFWFLLKEYSTYNNLYHPSLNSLSSLFDYNCESSKNTVNRVWCEYKICTIKVDKNTRVLFQKPICYLVFVIDSCSSLFQVNKKHRPCVDNLK